MPRTTLSLVENGVSLHKNYTWVISDGSVYTFAESNKTNYSLSKSRQTNNTPNFRSTRKEHLPMNPFTYSEFHNDAIKGTYKWINQSANLFGLMSGPLVGMDYDTDSNVLDQSRKDAVNANALNGSLLKLKGMKVNLGNVLGERKQTSKMILGTAQRIGNSLRALRKGNFRNAATALGLQPKGRRNGVKLPSNYSKALADEWLALQFGWKPLLNDVYDAAEDLARLTNEPRRFYVTASKTFAWNVSSTPGDWQGVPYKRTDQGTYTRKYVYIFSYRNEILADLSRFGITNPASVAWELTPWSFVVDWFIPIGNFIDTWDATAGFVFEKGCVTTFQKSRVSAASNATAYVNGNTWATVNARGSVSRVSCVRGALSAFPSPVIPRLGDFTLSLTRGTTITALLRQRLKL